MIGRYTAGDTMRLAIFIILFLLPASPALAADAAPEYRLQVGDQIKFVVWNEDGLTIATLVLPDGSVTLPLVGRFVVDGMTLAEVEKECSSRLAAYLVDPVVNIIVTDPHISAVKILGRVQNPGKFDIRPGDTLVDAIAYAGGFASRCDIKRILILNRGNARLINLRTYLENEGNSTEADLTVLDGDLIIVPEVTRLNWSNAMPYVTAAIQSLIIGVR